MLTLFKTRVGMPSSKKRKARLLGSVASSASGRATKICLLRKTLRGGVGGGGFWLCHTRADLSFLIWHAGFAIYIRR